MLLLLEFCLAALPWIFAATGTDLWTLRQRGRSLVLVFLSILGLTGAGTCLGNLRGLFF